MIDVQGKLIEINAMDKTIKLALNSFDIDVLTKYLTDSTKVSKTGKNQPKEKNLDIKIKTHRENRSLDANSYFHSLCNELAKYYGVKMDYMKNQLVTSYGTLARDKDGKMIVAMLPQNVDIREFYEYTTWLKDVKSNKGEMCSVYAFFKRTHEMDSKEFAKLLDGTRQECIQANENGAGISYLTKEEESELLQREEESKRYYGVSRIDSEQ